MLLLNCGSKHGGQHSYLMTKWSSFKSQVPLIVFTITLPFGSFAKQCKASIKKNSTKILVLNSGTIQSLVLFSVAFQHTWNPKDGVKGAH